MKTEENMILIVDAETTGLDPAKHVITEMGWILWNQSEDRIVSIQSLRVSQPTITREQYDLDAENTSQIQFKDLAKGLNLPEALKLLQADLDVSDGILGHNVSFDLGFLKIPTEGKLIIDTRTALPLPAGLKARSLEAITQFHNVRKPFGSHRAVLDVLNLLQVVRNYDWPLIEARAKSPVVVVQAILSYDEMQALPDDKKPKAFRFLWLPKQKVWEHHVLECDLDQEFYPFPTRIPHEPKLQSSGNLF